MQWVYVPFVGTLCSGSRSLRFLLLCITLSLPFVVGEQHILQPPNKQSTTSHTFVDDIKKCPVFPKRTSGPRDIHDLRPDDFSVVMALGDSVTAGCFAAGIQEWDLLASFSEWRGMSYASGGDGNATTIPTLTRHYNPTLRGASIGRNPLPEACFGPVCSPDGWNPAVDRLNGARSGAVAANLLQELRDYVVPQMEKHNVSDDQYKYLNLQIGANDLCQLCLSNEEYPGPGSPSEFEATMEEVIDYIRVNIPNTVVNLIGVFRVSKIWELTRKDEAYCQRGKVLPGLPRYTIGCACALLDGPVGEWAREKMDVLQEQYNKRLERLVKRYQMLDDDKFAILWQPANIPLEEYPIEALSDVDCFHPSLMTHKLMATGIWNRLTLNAEQRNTALDWKEKMELRCLNEDDRIQTKALLRP